MFTLISDPDVVVVPTRECGAAMVDLAEDGLLLVSPKRSAESDTFSFVRAPVAEMLLRAQEGLPAGYALLVEEGHRSMGVQRRIYARYLDALRRAHPGVPDELLEREATKYVAAPSGAPPHSTGGAVDVVLARSDGAPVDCGSTSDDTPLVNGSLNYAAAAGLPHDAQRHRELLASAMEGAGFVNYPAEWWHWSYGDRYWAYRACQDFAMFGRIERHDVESSPPRWTTIS